jgi:hypothetical protein
VKEYYLIIRHGYEGIQEIVYPTDNKDDVILKFNSILENIKIAREKYGNYESEDLIDMLLKKEITNKDIDYAKHNNPEDYCIYKWNGEKFGCACEELNVQKNVNKLY